MRRDRLGQLHHALNHTSVARVLFILALSSVLAALLARVALGEPITRRTVVAMVLALAGVTLMLGALGEGSLAGDGLSFVAALAFALMIVIGTLAPRRLDGARHLRLAGDPCRGLSSLRQSR